MMRYRVALTAAIVGLFGAFVSGGLSPAEAVKGGVPGLLEDIRVDLQRLLGATAPPSRFSILSRFNNEAVLDNETLLIWERSPGDTDEDGDVDVDDQLDWSDARRHCADKLVGGQKGWKLPSFDQLATLLDLNSDLCAARGPLRPCLPDGHPFVGVEPDDGVAATTWQSWAAQSSENPEVAWTVDFTDPLAAAEPTRNVLGINKTIPIFVWCVRASESGPSAY